MSSASDLALVACRKSRWPKAASAFWSMDFPIVKLKLKTPYHHGTTHLLLSPGELLKKTLGDHPAATLPPGEVGRSLRAEFTASSKSRAEARFEKGATL